MDVGGGNGEQVAVDDDEIGPFAFSSEPMALSWCAAQAASRVKQRNASVSVIASFGYQSTAGVLKPHPGA
ncbi:hypothetical protein LP419_24610 [Massilia sp. H-1]|nr:hypothetical protein LP419_24610 [Massilia sp. H-1]